MSKEKVVEFIKSYVSEFAIFFESCKDYQVKTEEKLAVAKKDKNELQELKISLEKLQEQFKTLNENNDIAITLNNDLQKKVLKYNEEIDNYKDLVDKLNNELGDSKKTVKELMDDSKEKDKIILQYKHQSNQLEEKDKGSFEKVKSLEEKLIKLEKITEKQKKEIESLRKDNETLSFEKISDFNGFNQQKLELKKAVSANEKAISHLTREKNSLEIKYGLLQRKFDKMGAKTASKEVQTDACSNNTTKEDNTKDTGKLKQKEDELRKVREYSLSLAEELRQVQEKLNKMQGGNSEVEAKLEECMMELKKVENEKQLLIKENKDLKRRREQASLEISQLNQKINRKSSKVRGGKTASQAVINIYNDIGYWLRRYEWKQRINCGARTYIDGKK